jgi:hypothetical protein
MNYEGKMMNQRQREILFLPQNDPPAFIKISAGKNDVMTNNDAP